MQPQGEKPDDAPARGLHHARKTRRAREVRVSRYREKAEEVQGEDRIFDGLLRGAQGRVIPNGKKVVV